MPTGPDDSGELCAEPGCDSRRAAGKRGRLLRHCPEHSRSPHAHYPVQLDAALTASERWSKLGEAVDAALLRMASDDTVSIDAVERMARTLTRIDAAEAARGKIDAPIDSLGIGWE